MPTIMSPTWVGGVPQPRQSRPGSSFAPGPQLSPEERKQQEEERQRKEQATADANTMNAAEAANKEDRRNRILFGDKAADLLSLSIPNFGAKPPVHAEDLMRGSPGGAGGGGGGGGKSGGGGGGSVSYAPTNFSNGDRYNANGYRADGRKRIQGGVSRDHFGGLDDYYAMQGMRGATPQQREAAVDDLRAQGITSGAGGSLLKNGERYNPVGDDPLHGSETYDRAADQWSKQPDHYAEGGKLAADETGIVADAGDELAVPHDGTDPVFLPAVPGAPDGYAFRPNKDVTILPNSVLRQLPQLQADGITPLGGGNAVLKNKYGTGFATRSPDGTRYFADPRTGEQMMPDAKGKFQPVPEVVPEGSPWRTKSGAMPGDPRIPRESIALFAQDHGPEIRAVQSLDPQALAAEMYLNDPNSALKEQWALRPAPAAGSPAPVNAFGAAARAAAQASGEGPGRLFSPATMRQAADEARRRMGSTSAGRAQLAQWMMDQPNTELRTMDIPGTDYVVPVVGNRPFGTLPKHHQPQPANNGGIRVMTGEDGMKYYLGPDGKPINPSYLIGSDGKPLHKSADHAALDWIYKTDPTTGEMLEKPISIPKGKKVPKGWQRMEDEDGDGVPDAVQAPAGTGAPGALGKTNPRAAAWLKGRANPTK